MRLRVLVLDASLVGCQARLTDFFDVFAGARGTTAAVVAARRAILHEVKLHAMHACVGDATFSFEANSEHSIVEGVNGRGGTDLSPSMPSRIFNRTDGATM